MRTRTATTVAPHALHTCESETRGSLSHTDHSGAAAHSRHPCASIYHSDVATSVTEAGPRGPVCHLFFPPFFSPASHSLRWRSALLCFKSIATAQNDGHEGISCSPRSPAVEFILRSSWCSLGAFALCCFLSSGSMDHPVAGGSSA
jgi:hypothetical protein